MEKKALHVLFVDHSGEIGGGQLVLEELATHLPIKAYVALLSPGPLVERLIRQDIHVVVLGDDDNLVSLGKETTILSRLWAARRLPRIVRALAALARQADVVYANSKKGLLFAALAARWAKRPLIWHQHDEMRVPDTLPLRAHLSEKLLVWLLNHVAAQVISVSQASADTLIAAGGRADLPIVIHNGLDPARFMQPVDCRAVRLSAGLPLDMPLIGCFGRLTALKGQTVLIRALSRLPQAHVVMVGGASFGESGYEATLRAQADHLGVSGRVYFLGFREDVPSLMQAVDVVAHTSVEFESYGRVIVEGMLSERPVVATAVGGVPELVEDGVSGLLVPPNDTQALAGALQRVLDDTTLAARLAAAGHARALERFTLDRVVREVECVVRKVALH